MQKWLWALALGFLTASGSRAGEVWKSTFDSSADGVVDVYDDNPNKAMIGPASGGTLQIVTQDSATNSGTAFAQTDRAGRPLGVAVDGHSEFSGLYTFKWSDLANSTSDTWEFAGFTASPASNPGVARAWAGALLRHRVDGSGNQRVIIGGQWGTTYGQDRNFFGTNVNLGPSPQSDTLQLAVSYQGDYLGDTGRMLLQIDLFGGQSGGVHLGSAMSDNIDGLLPWGTDPTQKAAALSALLPTHLGWGDYVATFAQRTTTWQVDSLAYYDTFDGALSAVVPEPASLTLLAAGGLLLRRRARRA